MQDLLNKFIAQFTGYGIDYDHAYGAQCYDVIQEWNVDWLDNRFLPGDYAYQLLTKNPDQYITFLNNSPTAHPEIGDIAVLKNAYNNVGGHTGVVVNHHTEGKSTDWVDLFEQNDPTGSVCHIKRYSYDYISGWLRTKKQLAPIPTGDDILVNKIKTEIDSSDSPHDKITKIRAILA
jgi:hypothetical protein